MPALVELPRFFRTVGALKPSQVGWRMRYLVQRRLESQSWYGLPQSMLRRIESLHAAPPAPHFRLERDLRPPSIDRLAELRAGKLTLLNEPLPFAGGDDWCLQGGRAQHRLWRYHLHYHGWLADLARSFAITEDLRHLTELRRWLIDWIDVCRPGRPGFAHYPWNSYAIAQRLWHWREIDSLVPAGFWSDPELPRARFLESLATQAEYLRSHLEWDLRGNHLIKDALGLAAAANLLGNCAPEHWLGTATSLAVSQVSEQLLPDGVHFERSPMYHLEVLNDLLSLIPLLREETAVRELKAACRDMAEPLRWLRHPSSAFPLFNDAASHDALNPDDLLAMLVDRHILDAIPEPCGLRHFPYAGLVIWQGMPWTVFFDVGEIGPEYQPGHAHADTFTVELSFDGQRVVVDPGTYCYDHDARRRYDRSTAAHNTVTIDGRDSSEVWHIFRVGRRALPQNVAVTERDDGFIAAASHTGYDHLRGRPRHRRHVQLEADALAIQDEITGAGPHRVEGGFLLAPEWNATATKRGWLLHSGNSRLRVDLHANQPVETLVEPRPWHPQFGVEVQTQRLIWSGNITPPFRLQTNWYAA
jgi:uncharacterized heparinase superfamily protein